MSLSAAEAPRRGRGCAGQVALSDQQRTLVRWALCEPWVCSPAALSQAVRFHRVVACRPYGEFTTMLNPRQILVFAPWQDWVISGRCRLSDRCPLYPRKRTCAVPAAMSALGDKRTHAAQ